MPNFLFRLFLFVVLLSHSKTSAQHDWTRSNPGGGGALTMVGATADGTLVAGSDLSGAYIKKSNDEIWKPLGATQGLNHSSVTSFGFHPTDGNTFIIATTIGAYKTTDGGETIYPVQIETNPNLGLGYVESIGMAISDPLVGYMAHHEYWVPPVSFLKTNDGGESWNLVTTTGIPENARITKIIVDWNDENLVYALTGKARFACSFPKLYKSNDGGQNWIEIGTQLGDILDIDLHPTNSEIVYVSTFEANDCGLPLWQYVGGDVDSGEFYQSVDGGNTFRQIGEETGIISIGINPNEISLVNILRLEDNPDGGTWSTIDGGDTWSRTGNVETWDIGRANPSFAYEFSFNGIAKTLTKNRFNPKNLNGSFGQWVWTSTDSGNSVNNINSIEESPGFFSSTGVENIEGNAIDVNDVNPNTIYVGYYDLGFFYSKDGGVSWRESLPDNSTYPEYSWYKGGGSNCNTIISDPKLDNIVWASFSADQPYTKSAIFKSVDYGENWTMSNTGLDSLGETTHGLSIDRQSPEEARILYVTQKGNVFKSTDGGANWIQKSRIGGLKFTAIDNSNSQIVYAGGENGLWRSNDAGDTWFEKGLAEMRGSTDMVDAILNEEIAPTHADNHDNDDTTPVLAPYQGVFEIKADPKVPNRVYVVGYGKDKGLYRSNDAGETWNKIYANDEMRGVAIAPDNSEVVYASASQNYHSGYPSEGYKTTDGIVMTYNASADAPIWADATDGMSWANGGRMEIEKGANPNIWAWSPGTGVQYALIPEFIIDEEPIVTLTNDIGIYPNPITEVVTIDFTGIQEPNTAEIFSIDGKAIMSFDLKEDILNKINVSLLASGIYVIKIGESKEFKFIKR